MFRTIIFFLVALSSTLSVWAQGIVETKPAARIDTVMTDITGILGAFPEEVKFLATQLQNKTEFVIQHLSFTEGTLNGQHVVLAQTGIGKVNASLTTILLIEHFHPKAIVFTGIAGAINPTLAPGDLVIGITVAHHDYGALTLAGMERRPTRDPATMQENPIYFPCDTSLTNLAQRAAKHLVLEKIKSPQGLRSPKIITGTIVTGDVFVSSEKATQELLKQMHAEATEMEGAAVAQVSYQQHTPFLVIRSMSDNASSTAHADIETFYQVAARNSANLVMAMMTAQAKLKK
jgi:adenosylhomocysteine nucleosidase